MDVEDFFFSTIVCGCDGSGWRWWLWYGWVNVVVGSAGLRKRETEEREIEREEE